jgi:hypothetical protein
MKLVTVFLSLSLVFSTIINGDESDNSISTMDPYMEDDDCFDKIVQLDFGQCLNCCKLPEMEFEMSIAEECNRECAEKNLEDDVDSCCSRICVLEKLDIILVSTDPNVKSFVKPEGIVKMFMNTVGNDPAWLPIVQSSTMRCFDDVAVMSEEYLCGNKIPYGLTVMEFCCFKENYLKCPYWNPQKIDNCTICRNVIEECLASTDDGLLPLGVF